jgi:hypothetical protein
LTLQSDGVNNYLYDGEGRVCGVQSAPISGMTTIIGYLYNADGDRVAKVTPDPLFHPLAAGTVHLDKQIAAAAVSGRIGDDPAGWRATGNEPMCIRAPS